MTEKKFKTDIKCSGCVAKVTPHLNELLGNDQWRVDLGDPSRILTVDGDVAEEKLQEALAKAGYHASKVD